MIRLESLPPTVIAVTGSPVVGKTTAIERIMADPEMSSKLEVLKSGDLLRKAGIKITKLSRQMGRGDMADTVLWEKYVFEPFLKILNNTTKQGIILDGPPRLVNEAQKLAPHVNAMIFITTDDDVARERASGRGRDDDEFEKLARRQEVFRQLTLPAILYMRGYGVPAVPLTSTRETTIEETAAQVKAAILGALDRNGSLRMIDHREISPAVGHSGKTSSSNNGVRGR